MTAPAPVAARRRRLALVIGSGSVKCAAALGLHRVLAREGIGLDLVVGCSAGSMYGAVIALGLDAETGARMSAQLWTADVTRRAHLPSLLRTVFPCLLGFSEHYGLRDDRLVNRRLHDAFGDHTFADTSTTFLVAATDFHSGAQVVLSSGRLADAVRASIAIPFALPPWRVGDRLLVDGFLSDPLPVGVAMREGADVILALGFESPYQERVRSAARFAFQVSSIMTNNLLKAQFAFHGLAHHDEVIPVLPRFTQRIRLFDTEKIPYIIEEGERAMREQLPYLRRLLAAAPAAAP